MRIFVVWLLIVFVLTGVYGCELDQDHFYSGTYRYTGYNLDGEKAVAGEIMLTVVDSRIEGEKNINIVGTHLQYLDEAGVGPIGGQIIENEIITIYLMESDGPYFLIRGKYDHGELKGNRYWGSSGGAPEVVIGNFTARKK